ncbi:MAG: nuclear transport factor 2 family protein [Nitriliruptorales bacterium]|nr:nuclear transport factor 2 family protein [Nitriliruptorales bacterium]
MDRPALQTWLAGYERAWRAPGGPALEEALEALFAPEATYQMAPFEEPYRGLPAIVAMWQAEREGPDEVFTMQAEILAVEGDIGVARLGVRYGDPVDQIFRDLWIVRFDDAGRCTAFEEWPFWPPDS